MFQDYYGDRAFDDVAKAFGPASPRRSSSSRPAPGRARSSPATAGISSASTRSRPRACPPSKRSSRTSGRRGSRSSATRSASGRSTTMRARYEIVLPDDLAVAWPVAADRRAGAGGSVSARAATRTRGARCVALALLCALAPAPRRRAHEARPAYLEIDETAPGPLRRAVAHAGALRHAAAGRAAASRRRARRRASPSCRSSPTRSSSAASSRPGTAGSRARASSSSGSQATITDVLVRVQLLDGTRSTTLVRPSRPWVEIAAASGPLAVLRRLPRARRRAHPASASTTCSSCWR